METNSSRTLLNTYTPNVNRVEIFRTARERTSGLDSRGIQTVSDMVVGCKLGEGQESTDGHELQ